MRDLEICKRIAEIEGFKITNAEHCMKVIKTKGTTMTEEYNPLTDDALCFKLIDKYNISINSHFQCPEERQCYIYKIVNYTVKQNKPFSVTEHGLNKAALLAIIEAYKND